MGSHYELGRLVVSTCLPRLSLTSETLPSFLSSLAPRRTMFFCFVQVLMDHMRDKPPDMKARVNMLMGQA
jgi:hypothetical protein